MLALTKKVDYGLIALCHLAQNRDRVATAREIAARYHVPQALLMNILKVLAHAELVRSSRGPKGGYELCVAPESLTLRDVIEALEGPISFVQCATIEHEPHSGRCELIEHCPISAPVRRLHARLKQFLTDITLADIAGDPDFGLVPVASDVSLTFEQHGGAR